MSGAEEAQAVKEHGRKPVLPAVRKRELLAELAGLSARAQRNPAVLVEVWAVRRTLDWGCRPTLLR